ncbi:5952_t:CDS:2 [Funneliformis mosseae]|uniref:5952_t:CDS:1 n=1 Tax=Funneliformis mosseae TaxID=27381 RepID=A0A9N9AE16_FUNMO|nr:5952_t:CDS:2 [Funneliformis mosseae]
MFVFDSIFKTKRTEPFWFKIIRGTIGLILTILILFYAFAQFTEFYHKFKIPGVLIFEEKKYHVFPEVRFCLERRRIPYRDMLSTQTLNPIQCECQTPNEISTCSCYNFLQESRQCQVYKQMGISYNTMWFTIDNIDTSFEEITFETSDESSQNFTVATFLTIGINEFNLQDDLYMKNPINSSVYQLSVPKVYLTGGQWLLLEYSFTIFNPYSDLFWNLIGLFEYSKYHNILKIDWYETNFPDLPQKNKIVVGIKGKSNSTRYEQEHHRLTIAGNISSLGGFYTACAGIFFYLFGNPKLSPWGAAQKTIFICWPCRRSFQKNLANRYVSSAGIPFGEKVKRMPPDSSIEERLQIIEVLLQEYYLDTYYIDQLKLVKRKFRKKRRDYEELEQLPPPEDDLTLNEQDYENSLMERKNFSLVDKSKGKERVNSRSRTSSYYHRNGSSSSPSMIQIIEPPPVNERDNEEVNISDDTIRQFKYSRRSRNSSLGTNNINSPAASGSISKSPRHSANSLPLLNFDK